MGAGRICCAAVDFIPAGRPCRMACNIFAVRDELDPRDHVPGGWRRETMVATVPRRSGHLRARRRRGGRPCRGRAAIAGWTPAADKRASHSDPRRCRSATPEADSVPLGTTAFRPLVGSARVEPVRVVGLFTAVRGGPGNGVRDADHDRNRVPPGVARRHCGDAFSGGRYLRSLRSGSRPSAGCGRQMSVAAAATNKRLSGLAGLVEAGTRPVRSARHVVPGGRRGSIPESRTVRMTLRCVEVESSK